MRLSIGWLNGIIGHWDEKSKRIVDGSLVFEIDCNVSEGINTWNTLGCLERGETPKPTIDCYGKEFWLTSKQLQKINDEFDKVVAGTSKLKASIPTM